MKITKPGLELIALRSFRYNHRMMQAGDRFEAPTRDGKVLIAAKRARQAPEDRERAELPPPPASLVAKATARPQLDHDGDGHPGGSVSAQGDDIAELRAAYRQAVGRNPFNGWDAATLREKIAAAGQ